MSGSEDQNTKSHPTRDLITWIVSTLAAVVALAGGAIALFHPTKADHPAAPSASVDKAKLTPEIVTVDRASAPGGVVAGVINGNATVAAPANGQR